jgi:hypothetical protein
VNKEEWEVVWTPRISSPNCLEAEAAVEDSLVVAVVDQEGHERERI